MKKVKNLIKIVTISAVLTLGSVAFSKIVSGMPAWNGSTISGMPSASISSSATGYFPQSIGGGSIAYCDDQDSAVRWGSVDTTTYYPTEMDYGSGVIYNSVGSELEKDADDKAWKKVKNTLPSNYKNLKVPSAEISNGKTSVTPSEHDHGGISINENQPVIAIYAEDEDSEETQVTRTKTAIKAWMGRKFTELGAERKPQPLLENYDYHTDYSQEINWMEGPKVAVIGGGTSSIYTATKSWSVNTSGNAEFDEVMNAYIFNGGNEVLTSRERTTVFTVLDIQTASWLQNDHEGSRHGYNADGSGSSTLSQGTTGGYALYNEAKTFKTFNDALKASGSYENMVSISSDNTQVFVNRVDGNRSKDEYIIGPFKVTYPHYTNISYIKDIKLEASGEDGNATLSYLNGDFEILAKGETNTYPESGDNFWIRVNASKANYPKSIKITPTFEYTEYCTAEYHRLEGVDSTNGNSASTGSRIYMYRGYIMTMNKYYTYNVTYTEIIHHDAVAGTDGYWECDHGINKHNTNDCPNNSAHYVEGTEGTDAWDEDKDQKSTIIITYTLYQACIKMDTTEYEVDDEQEVRTVTGGNPEEGYGGATQAKRNTAEKSTTIEINIKIAGYVWVDGTAGKESQYNGQKDDSQDKAMSGVKVILHQRKPDGAESEKATTTTDGDGHYEFTNLNAMYTYYVEFVYNGMYYQPTIYKANGVAWSNSSKGNDINSVRDNFNAKFEEIGSNPQNYAGGQVYTRTYLKDNGLIDEFGNPTGNNQYVNDCMMSSYTGYNKNGFVTDYYPVYKHFVIGDSINGDNRASLAKDSQENPINAYYMLYNGDYNNLYVNQGYVLRETVDLALHKDVYNATLEVKGKSETYKYNKNDGLSDEGFWDINTQISDAYLSNAYKNAKSQSATSSAQMYNQTDYTREIFKEDYNFKTATYGSDILSKTGMSSSEDELRVYVTYKITVRNQSDAISAKVTEVVDYFDKEYTLVESSNTVAREQKYKPYLGDRRGNKIKDVTTNSSSKYGATTESATADYNKTYITGFDDVLLDPDTSKDLYLYITFRVNNDKDGYITLDEATSDGNTNGYTPKQNIVEINGYKTYYTDRAKAPNTDNPLTDREYVAGDIAGLTDIDSVPGNVLPDKIPTNNGQIDSSTFEDDTSKGPNIRIRLNRENVREVNGTVFDDKRTVTEQSAQIGNGQRDDGDTGVNGVKVQLVELFKDENGNFINGDNGKPLEKVWRTMYSGDKSTQKFIIDNEAININREYAVSEDGQYSFKSFAPGYYIIRFIYGDGTESILGTTTTNYATGATEENSITNFFADKASANYKKRSGTNGYYSVNGENIGLNTNSYNGQDYKSTTYQLGVANGDGSFQNVSTGTYNYDFDAAATGLYSDAKDIYSRRLEVNSASQTLTNHIAEVESSFEYLSPYYNSMSDDDKAAVLQSLLTEFVNKTNMTAETGVMNIEFEYNRQEDGNKNNNYTNSETNIGSSNYDKTGFYTVADVDFGLTQRPQSELKTTKQIANVKVTLANGNTLFDASAKATNVMWIEGQTAHAQDTKNTYTQNDNYAREDKNGNRVSSGNTLVKIPAVRTAGQKGRVQLTMDEELMHGSTMQITYIITVANIGEVDYSDAKFYYTGVEDNASSNIVKTKVESIVDYVGAQLSDDEHATRNNLQFNADTNTEWEVVTFDSLKENGLVNANLENSAKKYTTIIKTKDDSSIIKELVPVLVDTNSTKIKEKWEKDPLNVLDAVNNTNSVTGIKLVLSEMITSDNSSDDLTYNNIVEITKTSSVSGRRMAYSVVGNQDPTQEPYEIDAASPQEVVILPPFGQNTIYYVLGIGIGVILIIGLTAVIVVTKKKKKAL